MKYPIDFYLVFFALLIVALSIKVVREDVRLVIFRSGNFLKIAGPGIVWIIPILDKTVKVNLPEAIPDWKRMGAEQLNEKIKNFVLNEA